jgi:hypothetical protein
MSGWKEIAHFMFVAAQTQSRPKAQSVAIDASDLLRGSPAVAFSGYVFKEFSHARNQYS